MIKSCIVGLGKMGISHCAIVNANPDVELVSVCDTTSFVLEAFNKYSKFRCYDDYKEMLKKEQLDSIIVATPTKYHFEIVNAALDAGLHVFCEKPFSLNLEEGKTMYETATEKKVVNQIGYHNRFIGTFNEMKRLLENNLIGEVYHFHGEAYGPVVTKSKSETWRSSRNEGGGCLYDYASHVLNLIQYILGPVTKCKGTVLKKVFSKEVEDAVYSALILENGLSGQLSVNWSDETYRKMSTSLTIFGRKGKIICDASELKIYLNYDNTREHLSKGWTIKYITDVTKNVNFYLRGEEYSAQMDYFFNCIKSGAIENINSFREGYLTDEAIALLFNDYNN